MKPEMRQILARESYEEKIRKVAQLIRLAKTFPRRQRSLPPGENYLEVRDKLFTGKSVEELVGMAKKL